MQKKDHKQLWLGLNNGKYIRFNFVYLLCNNYVYVIWLYVYEDSIISEVSVFLMSMYVPLTYTYLDCLLGVKMRGHMMAEIWEWLLMGSTADQYQDRPAGLLLWFVLVCRVMPRSLMFQDKLQLYKAKSSIFNSCFFILLYVYWKMEFNLFRFSTIIYLLASYCKWFYWTKVD